MNIENGVERTAQYSRENGDLSPFEVFRIYSAQQRQTAEKIARLFYHDIFPSGRPIDVLDIGAGSGDYQRIFLNKLLDQGAPSSVNFVWLEPNEEYTEQLARIADGLQPPFQVSFVRDQWESYQPDRQFDAVIVSHAIYYFGDENFDALFDKMISSLKPDGRLLVVAREKDEDYEFIQRFYERATGQPFRERTIQDAEEAISRLIKEKHHGFSVNKRFARSHIVFPFRTNESDTGKLVTFYLRASWEEMDTTLQQDIRDYLLDPQRAGQLQQVDAILIVQRVNKWHIKLPVFGRAPLSDMGEVED